MNTTLWRSPRSMSTCPQRVGFVRSPHSSGRRSARVVIPSCPAAASARQENRRRGRGPGKQSACSPRLVAAFRPATPPRVLSARRAPRKCRRRGGRCAGSLHRAAAAAIFYRTGLAKQCEVAPAELVQVDQISNKPPLGTQRDKVPRLFGLSWRLRRPASNRDVPPQPAPAGLAEPLRRLVRQVRI